MNIHKRMWKWFAAAGVIVAVGVAWAPHSMWDRPTGLGPQLASASPHTGAESYSVVPRLKGEFLEQVPARRPPKDITLLCPAASQGRLAGRNLDDRVRPKAKHRTCRRRCGVQYRRDVRICGLVLRNSRSQADARVVPTAVQMRRCLRPTGPEDYPVR